MENAFRGAEEGCAFLPLVVMESSFFDLRKSGRMKVWRRCVVINSESWSWCSYFRRSVVVRERISGVFHASRGFVKARREMKVVGLRVWGGGERLRSVMSAFIPVRAFCLVSASASTLEVDGDSVCSQSLISHGHGRSFTV